MIVIENSTINSLRACAVIVGLFIFVRTSGNRRVKTDIPIRFGIYATPVGRGGTRDFAGALVLFPTGNWATPFTVMATGAVSPINHTKSGVTHWSAILINVKSFWDGFRSATVTVKVNEGIDTPFPAQFVGWVVIMSRVQTKTRNLYRRIDFAKLS